MILQKIQIQSLTKKIEQKSFYFPDLFFYFLDHLHEFLSVETNMILKLATLIPRIWLFPHLSIQKASEEQQWKCVVPNGSHISAFSIFSLKRNKKKILLTWAKWKSAVNFLGQGRLGSGTLIAISPSEPSWEFKKNFPDPW